MLLNVPHTMPDWFAKKPGFFLMLKKKVQFVWECHKENIKGYWDKDRLTPLPLFIEYFLMRWSKLISIKEQIWE